MEGINPTESSHRELTATYSGQASIDAGVRSSMAEHQTPWTCMLMNGQVSLLGRDLVNDAHHAWIGQSATSVVGSLPYLCRSRMSTT
eukprot:1982666-Amphidinium_carterae.1